MTFTQCNILRNKNFDYSIYPIFLIIIGSCPSVTLEMQLFISFQWTNVTNSLLDLLAFDEFFPTMERSQVAYMRWLDTMVGVGRGFNNH